MDNDKHVTRPKAEIRSDPGPSSEGQAPSLALYNSDTDSTSHSPPTQPSGTSKTPGKGRKKPKHENSEEFKQNTKRTKAEKKARRKEIAERQKQENENAMRKKHMKGGFQHNPAPVPYSMSADDMERRIVVEMAKVQISLDEAISKQAEKNKADEAA